MGAIIGAIKKGKKVIAVPRLAKCGEHVDDHQVQLVFLAFIIAENPEKKTMQMNFGSGYRNF